MILTPNILIIVECKIIYFIFCEIFEPYLATDTRTWENNCRKISLDVKKSNTYD